MSSSVSTRPKSWIATEANTYNSKKGPQIDLSTNVSNWLKGFRPGDIKKFTHWSNIQLNTNVVAIKAAR